MGNLYSNSRTFWLVESCQKFFWDPLPYRDRGDSSSVLSKAALLRTSVEPVPAACLAHLYTEWELPGHTCSFVRSLPMHCKVRRWVQGQIRIYGLKWESQQGQKKHHPEDWHGKSQKTSLQGGPCSFPNLLTLLKIPLMMIMHDARIWGPKERMWEGRKGVRCRGKLESMPFMILIKMAMKIYAIVT